MNSKKIAVGPKTAAVCCTSLDISWQKENRIKIRIRKLHINKNSASVCIQFSGACFPFYFFIFCYGKNDAVLDSEQSDDVYFIYFLRTDFRLVEVF